MAELLQVEARSRYKIFLRYSDGVEGEVDLSDFAGKGVFRSWDVDGVFEHVAIGEYDQVTWSDEMELCSDALYLRLAGKSPEEVFPNLDKVQIHA